MGQLMLNSIQDDGQRCQLMSCVELDVHWGALLMRPAADEKKGARWQCVTGGGWTGILVLKNKNKNVAGHLVNLRHIVFNVLLMCSLLCYY